MFHTQEKWADNLDGPIKCIRSDAWLGEGYYFWYYESDAAWWGINSKNRTKYYQIYNCHINCENVLDTVFNEDHYRIWVKNVDLAIEKFLKKDRGKISIKYINEFFRERGVLDGIHGVMFQDISNNPDFWVVDKFQYKKRIQLVAFHKEIISNFALYFESEC
ncbi:MAG: hypothetical protein JNK08_06925 [Sediminibacterium sp.]|nr:hypothetical protein [Sediminibacterium sp.]